MSFEKHGKGYTSPRTLSQVDRLYAWKHDLYFPPVVVEISATTACNQKCRYCYVAGRTTGKLEHEKLVGIMPQLAEVGVKAVVFQGAGEPLMHPSLSDAIVSASKYGLKLSLTTNGVLLTPPIQERVLKHLTYIKFSNLDRDATRYAYKHGCKEKQWEYLVHNIRNAVELRKREDLKVFFLVTVYLSEHNFHDAYNIVKFCKELGVDYVSIQEAVYNEYSYAGMQELASKSFSDAQITEMRQKVATLKDNDLFIRFHFPINDPSFTNGKFRDTWVNGWCQGIKFSTLINSDGEVYACDRYWGEKEFSYGNIYEQSFEDIWKGDKRKEVVEYTNTTPPKTTECSSCNVIKINDILWDLKQDNKWRDFLV
jgi:GTP 3',8-cyclase